MWQVKNRKLNKIPEFQNFEFLEHIFKKIQDAQF
jgi:hypothetical protein